MDCQFCIPLKAAADAGSISQRFRLTSANIRAPTLSQRSIVGQHDRDDSFAVITASQECFKLNDLKVLFVFDKNGEPGFLPPLADPHGDKQPFE